VNIFRNRDDRIEKDSILLTESEMNGWLIEMKKFHFFAVNKKQLFLFNKIEYVFV
jgi:hypothetical protein